MFGGYEWVVTDKYDPNNQEHVQLKEGIEVGNGLPTLATPAIIKANLEEAGFEVRGRFGASNIKGSMVHIDGGVFPSNPYLVAAPSSL